MNNNNNKQECEHNENKCSICLEERNGDFVFLSCGHYDFCKECLFKWLETHNNCPLCRKKLNVNEERKANGLKPQIQLREVMREVNNNIPSVEEQVRMGVRYVGNRRIVVDANLSTDDAMAIYLHDREARGEPIRSNITFGDIARVFGEDFAEGVRIGVMTPLWLGKELGRGLREPKLIGKFFNRNIKKIFKK